MCLRALSWYSRQARTISDGMVLAQQNDESAMRKEPEKCCQRIRRLQWKVLCSVKMQMEKISCIQRMRHKIRSEMWIQRSEIAIYRSSMTKKSWASLKRSSISSLRRVKIKNVKFLKTLPMLIMPMSLTRTFLSCQSGEESRQSNQELQIAILLLLKMIKTWS